jgi:D-psicose/D-tagatose/L-ribulose 3-epimerase
MRQDLGRFKFGAHNFLWKSHWTDADVGILDTVRMSDHRNLRVNLDTYHMITEERDYGAAIRHTAPVLWGIHACENDRGVPGGGLVPWSPVFAALREVDRPVRLLLETYRTGPDGFGFERGIFWDLCSDPEAFVRQAWLSCRDGRSRMALS